MNQQKDAMHEMGSKKEEGHRCTGVMIYEELDEWSILALDRWEQPETVNVTDIWFRPTLKLGLCNH